MHCAAFIEPQAGVEQDDGETKSWNSISVATSTGTAKLYSSGKDLLFQSPKDSSSGFNSGSGWPA